MDVSGGSRRGGSLLVCQTCRWWGGRGRALSIAWARRGTAYASCDTRPRGGAVHADWARNEVRARGRHRKSQTRVP